jgi:DNA-binding CsgD family transcriptional regulator
LTLLTLTSLDAEKELRELLTDVRGGAGRVALVTGPVASGKTKLLNDFEKTVRSDGAYVLHAGCSQFDRRDWLCVPGQLFGHHPRLVHILRRAGAPQDTSRALTPAVEATVDALVDEVLRMSTVREVVVYVDDARYADPGSRLFLERLTAGVAGYRVLVVATDRTGTSQQLPADWIAAARPPHVRTLMLTPLSPTMIAEIAAVEFDLILPIAVARRIRVLAAGHESLTRALLHDFVSRRGHCRADERDVPVVGTAYRQAVLDSLHRFEPEVREIAEVLAVAGRFGTPNEIGELVQPDPVARAEFMVELLSSGWLCATGFRHPAAQEAVLLYMSRRRRSSLARRVGVVLKTAGIPAEDVAAWLTSVNEIDPLLATPTEEWARDPFDVPPRTAEPHRVDDGDLMTLAQARAAMHGLERGHEDTDARSGEISHHVELRASQLLVGTEFPVLLRKVLDEPSAAVAGETGFRSPRYSAAWALATVLTGARSEHDPIDIAHAALRGWDRMGDSPAATLAALTALRYRNEAALAQSWCDRLLAAGEGTLPVNWRAQLTAFRSVVALRQSDHGAALADAEAALALLPRQHWTIRLGELLSSLLLANVFAGRVAAAVQLRHSAPEAVFDTVHGLEFLYARGHFGLATGDNLAALTDFLRCGRLMTAWGIERDRLIPWRLGAAACYVAMKDYGKAVGLIDAVLHHLFAGSVAENTVYTGAAENKETRLARREAIFEIFKESAGEPGLYSAIEGLRNGAPVLTKHQSLARYKIHDRYTDYLAKLTPSEQRVAVLAARGATNQKIAHQLSIAVSTVEQHLTRTYRKLNFSGRSELRAKLG